VIVSFGSIRGSPGATSWALLLAAAWPADLGAERVVVEADPCGGVLGARYGLGVDPGVVSLVASLRHHTDIDIAVHGRQVAAGVWVVPGPESAEQAAAVWEPTVARVTDRLAADERVWFVDVGRGPGVRTLSARSRIAVVVTRGCTEHLLAVPSRVSALQAAGAGEVAVLVVGKSEHRPDEVANFVGCDRVWCVDDRDDLVELTGSVLAGGRARRAWLWRQACTVATDLAALAKRPTAAALDGPRVQIGRSVG
jgi:MinD-like ATPase involved in chromosome partitioning or flagellar assembly